MMKSCYPVNLYEIEISQSDIEKYIQAFPKRWDGLKNRLNAIKCFQEHWNLSDEKEFEEMFYDATRLAKDYIDNTAESEKQSYAPMLEMIRDNPFCIPGWFNDLFDESQNLLSRIEKFENDAKGFWKGTKHDINAMSQDGKNQIVYLWLKFPETYFPYLWNEFKAVSRYVKNKKKLEQFEHKLDKVNRNTYNAQGLFYDLTQALIKNEGLMELYRSYIEKEEGVDKDENGHTLAFDFAIFIKELYQVK